MKELESIVAAVVDGEPVSLAAVLRHAKLKNGLDMVQKAVDGILIQRAIEREHVRVDEQEIDRLMPELRGKTSLDEATAREEARKTIAFGKLKGLVTERLKEQVGRELLDAMDAESRRDLRDLLFLHWLKRERERAKVDSCLLRAL
jgi:hypothetical protein